MLDVLIITPCIFGDVIFTGLCEMPSLGQEIYSRGFGFCPGGLGANAGIAMARLGMKAAVVSRVGRDLLGDLLCRRLDAEGVDVSRVVRTESLPTAVSVALSFERDRCFVTYPHPSRLVEPLPIDVESVRLARHVLVSGPDVTRENLSLIRDMSVGITLDVGWDATNDPDAVLDLLRFVDVFVPNEVEACGITGTRDPRDAIEVLSRYVSMPVIKLGARGSMAIKDGRLVEVPSIEVEPVDTTGAGDVFAAGLLYGYLHGWGIEECLRLANVCGALSTQGVGGGCSAPRWSDIRRVAPDLPAV
ncbi:MAG: carbohydrate kinase family protein [Firmicutes bacterium]|jgi:sugar/nucleoside kinase (ribokinase family)|nr:carbohydrate kinase family protein [Bacillota bacterium]MDH7494717.1 carbohydrate kinase family protein [Bacillota bacterium]